MIKLREIRIKKGLYQKDIGEILGVTEATASRYENEKLMLNQNQIVKLCLELNVTPGELLGYQEAYDKYTNYLQSIKKEAE